MFAQVFAQQALPPFPAPEPNPEPMNSPDQIGITANLAALADKRNEDSPDDYDTQVSKNIEVIKSGNEETLRNTLAVQDQDSKRVTARSLGLESLSVPYPNSDLTKSFLQQETDIPFNPYALEVNGIKAIQNKAAEDPHTRSAIAQILKKDNGEGMDAVASHLAKVIILNKELDKLKVEIDKGSLPEKSIQYLGHIIGSMVNPLPTTLLFGVGKKGKETALTPGEVIKNSLDHLWSPNTPASEFGALLPEIIERMRIASLQNPVAVQQAVSELQGFNNQSVWGANFFSVLGLAPFIAGASRLAKRPTALIDMAGNRSLSADLSSAVLTKGEAATGTATIGVTPNEAIANALPGSLVADVTGQAKPWVGSISEIDKRLSKLKEIGNKIDDTILPERFTTPEQEQQAVEQAFNAAIEETMTRYEGVNILDTRTIPVSTDVSEVWTSQARFTKDALSKSNLIDIFIGPENGEAGFLSEGNAAAQMKRMGIIGKVVPTIDGKFAIKTTHNVQETGVVDVALTAGDFTKNNSNQISRWLKSPDNTSAEHFSGARHLSVSARSQLDNVVLGPLSKPIRAIGSAGRNKLRVILDSGEAGVFNDGKPEWYSLNKLVSAYENTFKRPPTKKEVVAYYAVKELNDVDYRLRNLEIYTDLARQGWRTVRVHNPNIRFDTAQRNGKIWKGDNPEKLRVFDLEEGAFIGKGLGGSKIKDKLATNQYDIIEFYGELPEYTSENIKYVLASRRSVDIGPLRETQLGYTPGGHRIYSGQIFVKQANTWTIRGDPAETVYYGNPHTPVVSVNYRDAKDWADRSNLGLKAYKEFRNGKLSEDELDVILEGTPFGTKDKISSLISERKLTLDHDYEVVFDKQQPSAYTKLNKEFFVGDEGLSGHEEWLNTTGRLFYSKKGERLVDPQGQPAKILDPYKATQRGIQNSMNSRGFRNYNINAIEEWYRFSKPFLEDIEGATPLEMLMNGQFKKAWTSTPENGKLHNALESNRQVIKRFMSIKTPEQEKWDISIRNLAKNLELFSGGKADFITQPMYDRMSPNPTEALNGWMFDRVFGIFAIDQFFLQSQQAISTAAVFPKWGAQALADTPFFNWALINKNPALLDKLSKLSQIHGFTPEDYKLMYATYVKSGLNNVNSDLNMLQNFSSSVGGSPMNLAVEDVRQAGRIPFMMGNQFNRQVGWKVAWKEVSEKFPSLDKTQAEFIGKVELRVKDLEGGVTKGSAAEWQQGMFKWATSYMSWQARALENVLPVSLGGNTRFTQGQKFRYAVGSLLATGASGTIGVAGGRGIYDAMNYSYKEFTGDKEDLSDETYRLVTKGLWDSAIYAASGLDTNYSKRIGLGAAWSDTVKRVVDGKFIDAVIGPKGQMAETFGGNILESIRHLVMYSRAERVDELAPEVLNEVLIDIVGNVSSLKRAQKAYWIWNYNQLKDPRTGLPLVDGLSKWYTVTEILGANPRKETQLYEEFASQHNRAEIVEDNAKQVILLQNEAISAFDKGDMKKFEASKRKLSGFLQAYSDPILRSDIVDKANQIAGRPRNAWDAAVFNNYKHGEETRGGK